MLRNSPGAIDDGFSPSRDISPWRLSSCPNGMRVAPGRRPCSHSCSSRQSMSIIGLFLSSFSLRVVASIVFTAMVFLL